MDPWEKSSTVDPEIRAYITSLVNAVGGVSAYDDTYSVGDDAVAVLKDLQRWLRFYDLKTDRLDVARCLAEANLVKGDLLEILALWPEEAQDNKLKSRLALACLELLVPLTWPFALQEERATVNHHRHVPYLQLALVGYKRAILHHDGAKILRTVVRIGLPAMATTRRERSRRDEGIIKLVLHFIRNMSMITQPQHLPSQGDENEVSRSATIEAFQHQDIFNFLLTVGSNASDEFQEQAVILLEILFYLLKGVEVRKLFLEKEQVVTEETEELKMLIQKEKTMLNSYNKSAPTRHNRFGTMIWVKRDGEKVSTISGQTSIVNDASMMHHMDTSKKWNKPQYRGKIAQDHDVNSEFGPRVELTENARKHLRHFVEDFIDSTFNPLFSSLRKAIEREKEDRETERTQHQSQFFYLISWFLQAEAARRAQAAADRAKSVVRSEQPDVAENAFTYIAAVLDQETFVLLNRQMQEAFDNKEWHNLQATLLCFTQILLTVQSMAESKNEEDQEIAENIQNRIFYEEATHDRLVQILRGYTQQGFAYLDAVTECAHVFVRLLERYSKQNADMQIRSKRRARKKSKQIPGGNADEGGDDADEAVEEEEREAHRTVSERKFDFARFSAKFVSQPCVNTFIALLQFYRELNPAQLKRCHRFFYRLTFKQELGVLLFRVDILQLLHKVIKGPDGLDLGFEGFKEWAELVQQIFRRCIKWIERDTRGDEWKETAVVEMLFSKVSGTLFFLQNGYERTIEKKKIRPPAELVFKASTPPEQRIAIAVSLMIELAQADILDWLKKQLSNAIDERQAWADEQTARADLSTEGEVGDETQPNPPLGAPTIFVVPDTNERKLELFKNKHLRLLLTTLGLHRLGDAEDVEASWVMPPELSASQLKEALDQIQKAEFDPPTFDDDKVAADFIRAKSSVRQGMIFDDDESSGVEAAFSPNDREKFGSGKRERTKKRGHRSHANDFELTEEELREREAARKEKEREKLAKIKSKKYITNSDDDIDDDAEFYRLEDERRKKMDALIRSTLTTHGGEQLVESSGRKRNRDGSSRINQGIKRRRKSQKQDEDDEERMSDVSRVSNAPSEEVRGSSFLRGLSDFVNDGMLAPEGSSVISSEDTDDDYMLLEWRAAADEPISSPLPLKEVSSNANATLVAGHLGQDVEDDDAPIVKSGARKSIRASLIIDSDSE